MITINRLVLCIGMCIGILSLPLFGGIGYRAGDYFDDPDVVRLIKCVKWGHYAEVEKLLARGVSLDVTNDRYVTPVYYFFLKRDFVSFKRMLELGASPDVYPTGIGSYSLINYSMEIIDDRYFKLLLKYNVDLEYEVTQRRGDAPLIFALYFTVNIRYLKMLLDHGINVKKDNASWIRSPLFRALASREYKRIILLLEYGTDFINDEDIKNDFIKILESDRMGQFKYTHVFREQKKLVRYLKEKFDIDIHLYYPDGK